LAQGFVSATAWASTSNDFNGSQSHALIWNTVTFSGAKTGDVATLTISGNATVSAALPVTGDTARANAAAILIDENLYPYGVGYFLAGNASTPESGAYTLQDQAQITNGDPYLMLVYVDAYSGLNGGPFPGGSASINDPFRLDVPVGVTVNYAFQPIAAVPEPSTWAMLLFGLVSIGSMGYRQSLKKNAATVVAS
jgi:hypothetical protein